MVMWDEEYLKYKFSDWHPMHPSRLELTHRLSAELGVLSADNVSMHVPEIASVAVLRTVHEQDFIDQVRRVSDDPSLIAEEYGLGTEDDPVFAGMHDAASRIVGGSVIAAQAIMDQSTVRAVNFAGGMHHAAKKKASGFCIYNDAAAAIQRMLDNGAQRVVYIDVDAHHGDGTESIFWDDERVLTISLHESGLSLFPGTGFANEIGGPNAQGSAVNVALPAMTGDSGWMRAFHAIVPQLVHAFKPEIIVSQHGCDAHRDDDMTNLKLSVDAQRQVALDIAQLADDLCEGRWLATGGGGYNVTAVVPRTWTHLTAIVAGKPVPLRTYVPETFRRYVLERYGRAMPYLMGEDAQLWWRNWEVGYDPADPVDRTIIATRKEVFPLFGLDPWFD
ncbi:acetoin utilization protein AcuC [Arthrobacter sp. NIO-1057]|uniref:acetoin utilization protein AcuC n=1 Tax=Arthrobacter sp. NIO-1057 TaxID=993071 RepID=UPI00071D15B2|nr:acetoin utilization protein AcuC [Arthrobacter sp. NIO-1057]KSU67340.1 acetoin utilization protein AcuC [Arthrobacter sp. NIO-1057]